MLLHGRTILIHAIGGLGNRLLSIFSAIREVDKHRYDTVIIQWDKTFDCSVELSNIIELKSEQILLNPSRFLQSPDLPVDIIIDLGGYDYIKSYRLFDSTNVLDYDEQINWARENINKYLSFKQKTYDTNLIGIHCRRSDWGKSDANCNAVFDDEDLEYNHMALNHLFYDYLTSQSLIDQELFITTDSISTLAFFRYKLPSLSYNKKSNYNKYTQRSEESMTEAIQDLASLASCKYIIRDSRSSFSLIASIFGNKPLLTWNRPVLVESGCGYFASQ